MDLLFVLVAWCLVFTSVAAFPVQGSCQPWVIHSRCCILSTPGLARHFHHNRFPRKNKRRASLFWFKASEAQFTVLDSPNSKPVRGKMSPQKECMAGPMGLMEGRKQRQGLETRYMFLCLAISSNRVHLSKVPITSQNTIKSCHPWGPN